VVDHENAVDLTLPILREELDLHPLETTKKPSTYYDRRLYIYNIPWEADEKQLTDYLNKFTKVEDVTIVREKDGKSRGFGFATCSDKESANRILKLAHQMGKRALTIKRAYPEKDFVKKKKSKSSGSPNRKPMPQFNLPVNDSGCPHLLFANVSAQHKDFKPKCDACGSSQRFYVWQCSNCQLSLCKICKDKLEEISRQDNLICAHNGAFYRTGSTDDGVLNIDYEGTCDVCGHGCPDTVWNCSLCHKKFCSKCKNLIAGERPNI